MERRHDKTPPLHVYELYIPCEPSPQNSSKTSWRSYNRATAFSHDYFVLMHMKCNKYLNRQTESMSGCIMSEQTKVISLKCPSIQNWLWAQNDGLACGQSEHKPDGMLLVMSVISALVRLRILDAKQSTTLRARHDRDVLKQLHFIELGLNEHIFSAAQPRVRGRQPADRNVARPRQSNTRNFEFRLGIE